MFTSSGPVILIDLKLCIEVGNVPRNMCIKYEENLSTRFCTKCPRKSALKSALNPCYCLCLHCSGPVISIDSKLHTDLGKVPRNMCMKYEENSLTRFCTKWILVSARG